jgi:hypothetical protein
MSGWNRGCRVSRRIRLPSIGVPSRSRKPRRFSVERVTKSVSAKRMNASSRSLGEEMTPEKDEWETPMTLQDSSKA